MELLQFQRFINAYSLKYYKDDKNLNKRHWIDISDAVPKSQIVYSNLASTKLTINDNNDDMIIELMAKAHRLYRKYIKINSTLEINISYELRNTYIQRMDKLDQWITNWDKTDKTEDTQKVLDNQQKIEEIYNLFTPCIEELKFLLDTSFTRFRSTKRFQKLDCFKNPKLPKTSRSWNSINLHRKSNKNDATINLSLEDNSSYID